MSAPQERAAAWTPGPWTAGTARKDSNFGGYSTLVHGPEVARIAKVYGGNRDDRETAKANARLIASAPALAEENARLREALGKMQALVGHMHSVAGRNLHPTRLSDTAAMQQMHYWLDGPEQREAQGAARSALASPPALGAEEAAR